MNRNHEFSDWIESVKRAPMPARVHFSAQRAVNRAKTRKKTFGIVGIPAMGLAALFLAFTILVNSSVAFARTMGEIPPLAQLAKAVAADASLKAAVENKYVQPVKAVQRQGDIEVTLEYVIADERQLSAFIRIRDLAAPEKRYRIYTSELRYSGANLGWRPAFGQGTSKPDAMIRAGDLEEVRLAAGEYERRLPSEVNLFIQLSSVDEAPAYFESGEGEGMPYLPKPIPGEWVFALSLDPALTLPGQAFDLQNRPVDIDGQRLRLKQLTVYPTRAVLLVGNDSDNTSTIASIDVSMKNDQGRTWAFVRQREPFGFIMDVTEITLESSYFANSDSLILSVEDVILIPDSGRIPIEIDIPAEKAYGLPENVRLASVVREGAQTMLYFEAYGMTPGDTATPFISLDYTKQPKLAPQEGVTRASGFMGTFWDPSGADKQGVARFYYSLIGDYAELDRLTLELVMPYKPDMDPLDIKIK